MRTRKGTVCESWLRTPCSFFVPLAVAIMVSNRNIMAPAYEYGEDNFTYGTDSSITTHTTMEEHGPVSITKSDLPRASGDCKLDPDPYSELPSTLPYGSSLSRRRLLIRAAFPVFLVIVTVSVVVGITASDKKRVNAEYGYGNPSTYYLPEPPSNLESVCSSSNIQSADGRAQCASYCQIAECCDYPTNLDISCLNDNEQVCIEYMSSCVNLQLPQWNGGDPENDGTTTSDGLDSNLPSAPADIDTTCATYNLGSPEGMAACRSVCKVAECCYQVDGSVDSCITDPDCEQYASCFFLGAADTINEDGDIETYIDQTCSTENISTADGLAECQIACTQAACCFTDEVTVCPQVETAYVEAYCAQFKSCSVLLNYLNGTDPNSTIADEDALKEQIDQVCNENVNDDMLAQCADLCDSPSCCLPYELNEYCPYGESGKYTVLGDGSERKMCYEYPYESCQILA